MLWVIGGFFSPQNAQLVNYEFHHWLSSLNCLLWAHANQHKPHLYGRTGPLSEEIKGSHCLRTDKGPGRLPHRVIQSHTNPTEWVLLSATVHRRGGTEAQRCEVFCPMCPSQDWRAAPCDTIVNISCFWIQCSFSPQRSFFVLLAIKHPNFLWRCPFLHCPLPLCRRSKAGIAKRLIRSDPVGGTTHTWEKPERFLSP